jgi:sugar phosphate isomerase/epimerase
MKVGVFAVLLADRPLGEALDCIKEVGCKAVELGTGGYSGKAHCDPKELLEDTEALKEFRQALEGRRLEISVLSCHATRSTPTRT